jgi:hypothetical protein
MPQRQEYLRSCNRHRDEAIELVLRPTLGEERGGQDDGPKSAAGYSNVDLAPQTVPDFQFELETDEAPTVSSSRSSTACHARLACKA